MKRLEGKNVIITGGARGMGVSHARLFVENGATVVITDVREEEGKALAAELGPPAIFLRHDVRQRKDWDAVVMAAESAFGPVTALINNAGIAEEEYIADATDEVYHRVIDVNQTSVFLGMRAVVPSLRRAGGGSIVNISSVAGLGGFGKAAAYCASKFAVRGMTKAVAVELASENIRVNSVHPGLIRTPLLSEAGIADSVLPAVPAGRLGEAEEVSYLALFLVSDESRYCTGAEFVIDGGLSAR